MRLAWLHERRTRQTDAAHVANVGDALVAEARRAEVNLLLRGEVQILARGRARQEGHEEVLEEARAALERVVRGFRQVRRLLQEDGRFLRELAHVDRDALFGGCAGSKHGAARKEDGAAMLVAQHAGTRLPDKRAPKARTAFWAAKMQFMIGMYCTDVSPETLMTRMRALNGASVSSLERRLMSEGVACVVQRASAPGRKSIPQQMREWLTT